MDLPLLSPPLYKMTQSDLQKFLPTLIRHSTGCKRPEYGKEGSRPKWWPKELPWSNPMVQPKATRSGRQAAEAKKFTDALREAVKSCYHFHGKDHMLRPHTRAKPQPLPSLPEDDSKLPERASAAEPVSSAALPPSSSSNDITGPAEAAQPFMEIFICLCEMEFNKKSDLLNHQQVCSQRKDKVSPQKSESAKTTNMPPPPEKYIESRVLCYDAKEPIAISRSKFMEQFGLIRPEKAKKMSRQQGREKKVHVDCEVIEIEDDDVQIISPPPPTSGTPKSLISQLSRDLSPTHSRRPRRFINYDERGYDSDESVDSRSSGGHSQPRRIYAVLNIDYCSPLGERVKKQLEQSAREQHKASVDSDGEEIPTRPYEEYCSTPKKSHLPGMVQKLRNRPNLFPVTFKKSRKHCPKYCHMFKFTNRQRHEFYLTKESGLDRKSRRLKRKYITCKLAVRLERLSKESIKKWTARKPRPYPQFLYPNMNVKNTSLMSDQEQLQQLLALHNAQRGQLLPVNNNQQIIYRPQLCEISNSSGNLVLPMTTESFRQQHSIPASALLAAMLNPQQQNFYPTGKSFYRNQVQQLLPRPRAGGVNITRPSPTTNDADPICIDESDEEKDDVVSISSTDTESGGGGHKRKRHSAVTSSSSQPPAKRARVDTAAQPSQPMLLFKCHLCEAEITCKDNFAAYIQSHFHRQHQVTNINLIEHTDANGHKVVSIVEEATDTPSPPAKQPAESTQNMTKRKLFNDKPGPLRSKRRSSRHSSVDSKGPAGTEVICLD